MGLGNRTWRRVSVVILPSGTTELVCFEGIRPMALCREGVERLQANDVKETTECVFAYGRVLAVHLRTSNILSLVGRETNEQKGEF